MLETRAGLVDLDLDVRGAQWLLCLSRHRSESGKRCLTVHAPGNLTPSAELGGNPSQVGLSNPPLQTKILGWLKIERDTIGLPEDVTVEATHHGPTSLECPVTFVEIGSDEGAWVDPELGQCVAKAVTMALSDERPSPPGAIAVGGGHYPEKFTGLMVEGAFSVGHIVPKYAMVAGMAPEMLAACVLRSFGGVKAAIVDWKGTPSAYKGHLKDLTDSQGMELVRV